MYKHKWNLRTLAYIKKLKMPLLSSHIFHLHKRAPQMCCFLHYLSYRAHCHMCIPYSLQDNGYSKSMRSYTSKNMSLKHLRSHHA